MQSYKLTKTFDSFRLSVNLELTGRVTGIYGPSGSGKTTLLNCIAGLDRPDGGVIRMNDRVLFDGDNGIDVPVRRRHVGYVFQDALLFEHLTVESNLRYARHKRQAVPFDQVTSVLELGDLLDRSAATLSGGQKRRVAIGRALLSAPSLLLLDEPLTGLDRRLAGKTLAYIHRVLQTFDIPALYVSHSAGDILFLCDEVAVMRAGSVVSQGPPGDLVATMETDHAHHHGGLKNIFIAPVRPVDPAAGLIAVVLGDQELIVAAHVPPETREVTLMVPARDIILASHKPAGLSARNVLVGRVERIDPVETHCVVTADVGVRWMIVVTPQAADELHLAPGRQVYVVVKASSVHCVDAHT